MFGYRNLDRSIIKWLSVPTSNTNIQISLRILTRNGGYPKSLGDKFGYPFRFGFKGHPGLSDYCRCYIHMINLDFHL
ncbi:hypothetical protein J28TS4_37170 [Paenibacillus lautus]|nr:hypothetical protein J28TS4_37170 [Paenibacillus lautus]